MRNTLVFQNLIIKATDVLLVKKGNAQRYNSIKSLKGKNIGVQQSSTQETEAKKHFKIVV